MYHLNIIQTWVTKVHSISSVELVQDPLKPGETLATNNTRLVNEWKLQKLYYKMKFYHSRNNMCLYLQQDIIQTGEGSLTNSSSYNPYMVRFKKSIKHLSVYKKTWILDSNFSNHMQAMQRKVQSTNLSLNQNYTDLDMVSKS